MTTKIVHFTANGRLERAELQANLSAAEVKGERTEVLLLKCSTHLRYNSGIYTLCQIVLLPCCVILTAVVTSDFTDSHNIFPLFLFPFFDFMASVYELHVALTGPQDKELLPLCSCQCTGAAPCMGPLT